MQMNQGLKSLLVELVQFLAFFEILGRLCNLLHPLNLQKLLLQADILELVEHFLRDFILEVNYADLKHFHSGQCLY